LPVSIWLLSSLRRTLRGDARCALRHLRHIGHSPGRCATGGRRSHCHRKTSTRRLPIAHRLQPIISTHGNGRSQPTRGFIEHCALLSSTTERSTTNGIERRKVPTGRPVPEPRRVRTARPIPRTRRRILPRLRYRLRTIRGQSVRCLRLHGIRQQEATFSER